MTLPKFSILLLSLFLLKHTYGSDPIPLAECKTAQIVEKDGYVYTDQTALSEGGKLRMINHAISGLDAFMSLQKLIRVRCLPSITPSFYLYNAANALGGITNVVYLFKQGEESQRALERYSGSGANGESISSQVAAFDAAYEIQIAAHGSAKNKAKWLKVAKYARGAATASAAVETIVAKAGIALGGAGAAGGFKCYSDGQLVAETKDAIKKLREADPDGQLSSEKAKTLLNSKTFGSKWYLIGLGSHASSVPNTAIIGALLTALLKDSLGEKTPKKRIIYYGAKTILARQTQRQAEQIAGCMKKRADEYASMADTLRSANKNNGPPDNDNDTPPEVNLRDDPNAYSPGDNFTRDDFSGLCMKQGRDRLIHDPQCSCKKTNSCYRLPNFPNSIQKIRRPPSPFQLPFTPRERQREIFSTQLLPEVARVPD